MAITTLFSSLTWATERNLPYPSAPGTYTISGSHSELGPYSGALVVKPDQTVQRWIEFRPAQAPQKAKLGLAAASQDVIQQLWQGNVAPQGISFTVRTSHVMSSFSGFTLPKEGFQFQTVTLSGNPASFTLYADGTYTETYFRQSDSTSDQFVPEQRVKVDAYGTTGSELVEAAKKIGIEKAIEEYRKLPQFDPYRDRVEFRENQQWRIRDFTDLDAYRATPNLLRVRNMSLTPLSIGEAQVRRVTFGPRLFEKERYKHNETRRLMNEFYVFQVGEVDANGRLVRTWPQGDTALWMGDYIWSQYLRYLVLHDAESYESFRQSVIGMTHLLKVSNDPTRFARNLYFSPPAETSSDPNVRQGTGIYANYKFDSRSNNDMTKGFIIGFLIGYLGLEPNDPLRAELPGLAHRFRQVEPVTKADYNKAAAAGLECLWAWDTGCLNDFIDGALNLKQFLGDEFNTGTGFHWGGIENNSGTHLNFISSSTQYLISSELLKLNSERVRGFNRFKNELKLKLIRDQGRKNMVELAQRMQKTHLGYLNILVYALTHDESVKPLVQEGIQDLLEMPMIRTVGDMMADPALQPDWCISSWPREPWKAAKGLNDIDVEKLKKDQKQGAYAFPWFEGAAWGSEFAWKDSLANYPQGGSSRTIAFSPDYLISYWMARWAGLLGPQD